MATSRGRLFFCPARPETRKGLAILPRKSGHRRGPDGLCCEPDGPPNGYDFEGPTRFDKLFSGIAVERPKLLVRGDTTGCESIGPEDTFDGDYGRLLDRVCVKGVASPAGSPCLHMPLDGWLAA